MRSIFKAGCIAASVTLAATLAGCGGSSPAGSTSTSGCTPSHTFSTLEAGKLSASVYVSPPYTDLASAGGDLGGIDGKIIAKIAAMECLTLDAKPVDGAALINSIVSKRADLAIGGVYFTEERDKTLNLSDAIYRDGMSILSKIGVADLGGLAGKSTGVIQGYLWNKELQDALGSDHVRVFQDSTSMLADLDSGRLDAAVLTSAEAAFRAKNSSGLQAKAFATDVKVPSSGHPGKVILASTKGNDAITTAFNEDIKRLLSDGTIAEILKSEGMDGNLAGQG